MLTPNTAPASKSRSIPEAPRCAIPRRPTPGTSPSPTRRGARSSARFADPFPVVPDRPDPAGQVGHVEVRAVEQHEVRTQARLEAAAVVVEAEQPGRLGG